jgi:hypothetical protein
MRRMALPVAVMMLAVWVGSAAAGTGYTYHGRITGATFTCGGDTVAPYDTVVGTWNLNASGNTAIVTLDVFYDGGHHLSFGMPGGTVVAATADSATVTFGSATASITDGVFAWSTPVGSCTASHPYDFLTYHGAVGRS